MWITYFKFKSHKTIVYIHKLANNLKIPNYKHTIDECLYVPPSVCLSICMSVCRYVISLSFRVRYLLQ